MPDHHSREVRAFIKRVLELQTSAEEPSLDEDQLEALARKYGLSDESWQRLRRELSDHLERGKGFLAIGEWSEAIAELEPAAELAPHDANVLSLLAEAYVGRHRETRTGTDRQRAEQLFRRALELDPGHHPAIVGISGLKPMGRRLPVAVLAMAVLMLAVAALLVVVVRRPTVSAPQEPVVAEIETNPAREVPVATPATEVELPVSLAIEDAGPDLVLRTESSILSRYSDSFSYQIRAVLIVGGIELRALSAEVELVDDRGTVVATLPGIDILARYSAGHLPGDSVPFRGLLFESRRAPQVTTVRVRFESVQSRPFVGDVERGARVEWEQSEVAFPPNMMVELRERAVRHLDGGLLNEGHAKLELELELVNSGRISISELELRVEPLDRAGNRLRVKRSSLIEGMVASGLDLDPAGIATVVRRIQPRFEPGDRRVAKVAILIPDAKPSEIGDYRIFLSAID